VDFDLRFVLVLLGIAILGVIIWDAYRKKKIAAEKANDYNQEALDEMMESRDLGGFDITGVGASRAIDAEEFIDEPMVAIRNEDLSFEDEGLSSTEAEPELIVSLNIIAKKNRTFNSDKLLHCMLSRGLRFGDMNIFHRHKNTSGEGRVQFSLANALKPGTFDLDDMTSFETKGISLFMTLPGPDKPTKAYQIMLDTAQHLATELEGQLLDSSRNSLTQQSIQHLSDKVQEYERRNIGNQH